MAAPPRDFGRFDGRPPSLARTVLRTVLFDRWVRDFPAAHPSGPAVETGTGLPTRHERVDNGGAHWFEPDHRDVIEARRAFSPGPRLALNEEYGLNSLPPRVVSYLTASAADSGAGGRGTRRR